MLSGGPGPTPDVERLCQSLERLYRRYNRASLIRPDPLQFVHRYRQRRDREVVGLLAALMAFGRVTQIEKSLGRLFDVMGPSPYRFVQRFTRRDCGLFDGFRHRFVGGEDVAAFLVVLRRMLAEYETVEQCFLAGYAPADPNVVPALARFRQRVVAIYERTHANGAPRSFRYLVSGTSPASACKRLNLFLRWMVRRDNVDIGLWRGLDPARLIVPMDVHLARISRMLGFHNSQNITCRTAVEVTEAFAAIRPDDPVRYDFALCRCGMLGQAFEGGGESGTV